MNADDKKKGLFLYVIPSNSAYYIEESREYSLQSRPKLGMLYLASTLKKRKGISCEIWDQTASYYSLKDIIMAADSKNYLFIGFYSAISMEERVIEYIEAIRRDSKIKIPILVGGPSFPNAENFLKAGCDIVCNGEGEETICQIADFIDGRKALADVKGISYMRDGKIINAAPQPLIEDINQIPFPDYSLIDFDKYCDFYIFTMKKPYTTMITTRGCPFDCVFCDSHGIWGRRCRARSADNVLAEIDELVGKHRIRYIAFQDDVFGMDYDWTEEFCGRLKDRKYNLRWMCILHPFSFKKEPLKMLRKLKSAGCGLISTGLQSAHPEILKRLNRSPDEPRYIKKLLDASHSLDMLSLVSFIFGSPGETRETIQTSLNFLSTIKPNYASFYSMMILPGSALARKYGLNAKLCELSKDEIDELCRTSTRRFYLKPRNFARNVSFVLRKNPSWFFVGFKHLLGVMDSIGLGKKKG